MIIIVWKESSAFIVVKIVVKIVAKAVAKIVVKTWTDMIESGTALKPADARVFFISFKRIGSSGLEVCDGDTGSGVAGALSDLVEAGWTTSTRLETGRPCSSGSF